MSKTNTYKAICAREMASKILGNDRVVVLGKNPDNETLYAWLAEHGYRWDVQRQAWRERQPGTHGPLKRPIIKESNFVLVRIMAKREILDRDRENFALAWEAIGYEIVSYSEPMENSENGFYRVYIKAKGN